MAPSPRNWVSSYLLPSRKPTRASASVRSAPPRGPPQWGHWESLSAQTPLHEGQIFIVRLCWELGSFDIVIGDFCEGFKEKKGHSFVQKAQKTPKTPIVTIALYICSEGQTLVALWEIRLVVGRSNAQEWPSCLRVRFRGPKMARLRNRAAGASVLVRGP